MGLYGAVRSFKPGLRPFKGFAAMCVERHLIEIVRRDTSKGRYRQGDGPLSLDAPIADGELCLIDSIVDERAPGPGDHERAEQWRALFSFIATRLSDIEREALVGIARGDSYDEILDRLPGPRRSRKNIDNAVQRARRLCAPFLADLRDAA